MSQPKGTSPQIEPPANTGRAKDAAVPDRSLGHSGRATFDSRGNAVWEWKTETGKYSVDVSTQRLKSLEASELSIEETARAKKPNGLQLKDDAASSGGFNPYDHGSTRNNQQSVPLRPTQPGVNPGRKPVKDLKRLQEWMEMKKRLANQKDDD